MTGLVPYIHFPGTAREALTFYGDVFGSPVELHTFADFGRADGPADAVAHGYLTEGPVALFGADVAGDEASFRSEGLMLSLLGTADSATLQSWFSRLSEGGRSRGRLADAAARRLGRAGDRPLRSALAHRVRGRITSTSLPRTCPCSLTRCASAICSSG
jgi:PhnB protein